VVPCHGLLLLLHCDVIGAAARQASNNRLRINLGT
jgi:hypothetical protein